eukprot:scaffold4374_cov165-Amphora_coffeaeformis.AAC.6
MDDNDDDDNKGSKFSFRQTFAHLNCGCLPATKPGQWFVVAALVDCAVHILDSSVKIPTVEGEDEERQAMMFVLKKYSRRQRERPQSPHVFHTAYIFSENQNNVRLHRPTSGRCDVLATCDHIKTIYVRVCTELHSTRPTHPPTSKDSIL